MAKIIHSESEIIVGKLYKSLKKEFYDKVLYLGCGKDGYQSRYLVIVMDESCGLMGYIVQSSINNEYNSLWNIGFEEQDG